jgi:hypothetical protein
MNEDDHYLEACRLAEAERVHRGYVGEADSAPLPNGKAARFRQERAPKATVKEILRGCLQWFKIGEIPQQQPVFSETDRISAHGLGVRL